MGSTMSIGRDIRPDVYYIVRMLMYTDCVFVASIHKWLLI